MDNKKVFNNNIDSYLGIINNEISKRSGVSKLGDYIKVQGGNSFKASQYVDSGIPIIRISNFNYGKVILDEHKTRFYDESDKYKIFELHKGDIIIAMTGGTIGKLAIVQGGLGKIYLNQRVGRFQIINKSLVDSEYLYWIARGVENIVKSMGYGGAQPNVSGKQIESLKFPFPKKEIQKQIVSFLNNLMNGKLENKEYFNKNVEDKVLKLHEKALNIDEIGINSSDNQNYIKLLKQSILQEAIGGKLTKSWRDENKDNCKIESASILLGKIKAEKENLIQEKKLKAGKKQLSNELENFLLNIPSSWEYPDLDDITQLITDGTHQTPHYTESGRIFLSAQNVKPFRFMPANHKYVSEKDYQIYIKNKVVEVGDLLLGRVGAGIGETAVVDQKLEFAIYVSLGLVKTFKNYTNPNYLAIVFNSLYGIQYSKGNISSTGVSAGNFNLGKIRSFPIPFPPLEEQKEIVKKVDELMKLCDELEKQTLEAKENSENLMKAVLGEVFEK